MFCDKYSSCCTIGFVVRARWEEYTTSSIPNIQYPMASDIGSIEGIYNRCMHIATTRL